MAIGNIPLLTLGLTSAAALAQYQPVQASGVAAVAAGNAVGFAQVAVAAAGTRFPAVALGTSIAVAGAAIAVGALVEVHTTVTQVVTKAAGIAVGRAMTAAANAGDLIEVLIIPQ